MTAKKTPSTSASKSTKLTDAPKTTVLTNNSNNSMQSNNPINSTNAVNSDNAVNRTTTVNPDNLFGSDQNATEVTAQPKQQRIGKQQRKSDFADFKAAYLCKVREAAPCQHRGQCVGEAGTHRPYPRRP